MPLDGDGFFSIHLEKTAPYYIVLLVSHKNTKRFVLAWDKKCAVFAKVRMSAPKRIHETNGPFGRGSSISRFRETAQQQSVCEPEGFFAPPKPPLHHVRDFSASVIRLGDRAPALREMLGGRKSLMLLIWLGRVGVVNEQQRVCLVACMRVLFRLHCSYGGDDLRQLQSGLHLSLGTGGHWPRRRRRHCFSDRHRARGSVVV